eukprot:scaffold302154_cov28-Tisochrysis_lutea.AAC.2
MPPPQSPMPTGQAALVAQLKRYFVTTRASKSNRRTLKQRPVWLDWWWRQLHSSTGRQHGRVVAERAFERIFSRWAFLGVVEGSRENFRCASLQSTGGVWNLPRVVRLIEEQHPHQHPAIRPLEPDLELDPVAAEEAKARKERELRNRRWSTTLFLSPRDTAAIASDMTWRDSLSRASRDETTVRASKKRMNGKSTDPADSSLLDSGTIGQSSGGTLPRDQLEDERRSAIVEGATVLDSPPRLPRRFHLRPRGQAFNEQPPEDMLELYHKQSAQKHRLRIDEQSEVAGTHNLHGQRILHRRFRNGQHSLKARDRSSPECLAGGERLYTLKQRHSRRHEDMYEECIAGDKKQEMRGGRTEKRRLMK